MAWQTEPVPQVNDRASGLSPMTTICLLCGATRRVGPANELAHEGCCPHFMRGPDPGGDPDEWPTLLDALDKESAAVSRSSRDV